MNKEPETYEELIRMKRCVELTKYYNVTKEELEQIYNFLAANPNGQVDGKKMNLSLIVAKSISTFPMSPKNLIKSSFFAE